MQVKDLLVLGNAKFLGDLFNKKGKILAKDDLGETLNRSTAVNAADTNYTTLMARGTSLNASETTPAVNGAIAWQYE